MKPQKVQLVRAGHPAHIAQLGTSPAAQALQGALTSVPALPFDLAEVTGYSIHHVRMVLWALSRLGAARKVPRRGWVVSGAPERGGSASAVLGGAGSAPEPRKAR